MSHKLEYPLASRRILIVDDQPSIRGVLEVALTEAGANVWTAADGPSALQAIEEHPPDLILLDLVMPGMNGWAVIDALKARPQAASIPVVLETSAEDFASFDRARRQGVAAFLSKPFRLSEVVETCRRVIEGARPLQGRPEGPEAPVLVQVRDSLGDLLTTGHLLDLGARGAQVDLDSPLALCQRITFTANAPQGTLTRSAEVRWVTQVAGRFHHGLALRDE